MTSTGILQYVGVLLVIVGSVCDLTESTPSRGLIVTTAGEWVNGTEQRVCIVAHQLNFTVRVNIRVANVGDENDIYARAVTDLSPGASRCTGLTLAVNKSVSEVKVIVHGYSFPDRTLYNFSRNVVVGVEHENLFAFIETDKPIYKPSDKVRLRLLALFGPELKLVTDPVSLVYIENPSRTRVMQWKDLNADSGLVELEMQLSDEPPLGEWTINAFVRGQQYSRTFTVKEYVLPKFDVMIDHPSSLSRTAEEISWKVCARYTYGEPVSGEVKNTSACMREISRNRVLACMHLNGTKLTDGCAMFRVNSSTLRFPLQSWRTYSTKLHLTANVEERGTGVILNASHVADLKTRRITIDLGSHNLPYFKPGLPFNGQGVVTRHEATLETELVEVRLRHHAHDAHVQWTQTVSTDSKGRFRFTIPPSLTWAKRNSSVTVQARILGEASRTRTSLNLKPWYSPSHSYLYIHPPEGAVACNSQVVVRVTLATQAPPGNRQFPFVYQIMSRGDVVETGSSTAQLQHIQTTLLGESGQQTYNFTFNLTTTPAMSGSFDLVVFHLMSTGETVADTAHVVVEQCLQNEVTMNFTSSRVQPGHSVTLRVTANPHSLCAVAVVDKSIELMGSTSQITRSKIGEVIGKYDLYYRNDNYRSRNQFCQSGETGDASLRSQPRRRQLRLRERQRRMVMWPGLYFSNFVDSKEAFINAGMQTLTDLMLETRPCQQNVILRRRLSERIILHSMSNRGMPGPAGAPEPEAVAMPIALQREHTKANRKKSRKETNKTPVTLHRTYFPETWLWQLEHMGSSVEIHVPVTLPHTITDWIGSGFCVNPVTSVGVSEPFKITAFQPFFVSFTLPYSMVRGESVDIPVTVFNYMSTGCLQVSLVVDRSESFELLRNNSQSTPNAAQLNVCGRATETHSFTIVPRQLGRLNLTVKASSVPDQNTIATNSIEIVRQATTEDIVTRQLLVIAEGKEEEYARSAYVCATSGNQTAAAGNWSLTLPEDVVTDSVRARINVIGDVMGPALSGLDSLLKLPTGCGEQNMLRFAPNIYVLQYLTGTNQLTANIQEKAIGFLQIGYQRELTYRHTDGSYSAFGNSDGEGSMWLTAFVVRAFANARPFIFIDQDDLDMSISWIMSHQQENGCFRSVGKVLHKEMKGGLQSDGGSSPAALTAYIVISLLEANVSNTDSAIENAMHCLAVQSISDVYTLALMSYTHSLYGRDTARAQRIYDQLQAKAVHEAGMLHWTSAQTSHGSRSAAADVEMTSYVLLGMLKSTGRSSVTAVVPIVRWLTTQMNGHGGFASTQDTVLALQALSQFAKLVYGRHNTNALVTVSGRGLGRSSRTFTVNNDNRLVQQTIDSGITLPTNIHYSVTGTGCALVQAAVKYNTLKMSGDEPQPAFILRASIVPTESCKKKQLNLCARYSGVDSISNMAVVTVKMVSGWIPDKTSIHTLKNDARLAMKRADIDKNIIHMYFDEFDKIDRCWNIGVVQDVPVTNTRPALVHIYDYYAPEMSAFAEYSIESNNCLPQAEIVEQPAPVALVNPRQRGRQQALAGLSIHNASQSRCPTCHEQISAAELRQLWCQSTRVYRMQILSRSRMRLIETLRPAGFELGASIIRYSIRRRCNCSVIRQGAQVFVLAPQHLRGRGQRLKLNLRSSLTAVISASNTDPVSCSP